MYAWRLPFTLNINGKDYKIRTDYRVILDIIAAMNDKDIFNGDETEEEKEEIKAFTMLDILFLDIDSIPDADLNEAIEKACEFIDCGIKGDSTPRPRTMDWKQDAPLIVAGVNKVAGADVRQKDYLHWWSFMAMYMEIGESTFSTVLSIRDKKRKGKLEKWEREYYKQNKNLIELEVDKFKRSKEEQEELDKLFGRK